MTLLPYIFAFCLVSIEIWAIVYLIRALMIFRLPRLQYAELFAIVIGVAIGIILSNQYSRFWSITYPLSRTLKVIGFPFPIGFFGWEDFGRGDFGWKDYFAPGYYVTFNIITMAITPHIIVAIAARSWNKVNNE